MSKKKRTSKPLAFLFVSLAGLAILLPTLLSTPSGNEFLLSFINSNISERLTAKKITLSWFEYQQAEGLEVYDQAGNKLVYADLIHVEKPFLMAIWNFYKSENPFNKIEGFGALNVKNLQLSETALAATKIQGITTFGPTLTIDLSLQLEGNKKSIQSKITGSLGAISLNGYFDDSFLYLHDPLLITTTASPELQKTLAVSIPFFEQMVSSQKQIKLTLFPEKFAFPIADFSPDKIQIGKLALDAGILFFRNQGNIKELVSSLVSSHVDTISVWTTPLYASILNGIFTLQRMDMLVLDQYPMAIWGTVDLIKDQLHMTLGLSTITLAKAFKIKTTSKDLVQIPIKGSLNHAKIDHLKAATKIGALIAKNNSRPETLLISSALELLSGKEEKAPKPTTSPLPWENKRTSS